MIFSFVVSYTAYHKSLSAMNKWKTYAIVMTLITFGLLSCHYATSMEHPNHLVSGHPV